MDFSRQGVRAKQRSIKSVQKKLSSKLWIMVFRVFIIGIVLIGIVGVMAAYGAFKGMIDSTPEVQLDVLGDNGYSSTSYFSDGDGGVRAVIMQRSIEVNPDDTVDSLSSRLMEECEWPIMNEAISLFCAGRLYVRGKKVEFRPSEMDDE